MQDYTTAQKQQFLRDEIIDKGFDRYEFSDWLETQKTEGYHIENWSFQELQQIVKNFQEKDFRKVEKKATTANKTHKNNTRLDSCEESSLYEEDMSQIALHEGSFIDSAIRVLGDYEEQDDKEDHILGIINIRKY